ncbi:MAG: VWA domain-containing protein, partial [Armatimonadetes bacterium]|nr:VWA domain-containing protein [Armatimonadota bacterium]
PSTRIGLDGTEGSLLPVRQLGVGVHLLDVVFVFDTTGSMADEINGLLRISARFAGILAASGSDYRIGMVTFGAIEDGPVVHKTFALSNNLSAFQSFLRQVDIDSGGTEDQPTAVKHAIHNLTYRPNTRKFIILVTDEPLQGQVSMAPGNAQPINEWNGILQEMTQRGFTGYAVCNPEEPYLALARRTGGKFYDISQGEDFTDIIVGIAQDINASITR